jgi:hypothetical protein
MALSFDAIRTRLLWSAIKIQLSALAYANGLPVTSWIPGEPTERWLDITPRLMAAVISDPLTQLVRGMFLDLATDPGDLAADGTPDMSADQTPRPGFLSALGLSWFGTARREQTYAVCTVTVRNDGSAPTTPARGGEVRRRASHLPQRGGHRGIHRHRGHAHHGPGRKRHLPRHR